MEVCFCFVKHSFKNSEVENQIKRRWTMKNTELDIT